MLAYGHIYNNWIFAAATATIYLFMQQKISKHKQRKNTGRKFCPFGSSLL